MTDTLEIVVAVVAVGVAIVLALAGAAWRLGGQLGHMESRLEGRLEAVQGRLEARLETVQSRLEARLETIDNRIGDLGAGIRSLNRQLASIVGLLSSAFMFLQRSQAITDEEYQESVGKIISLLSQGSEDLVDRLAREANPLTSQEAQRFRELVNKARRGEFFTRLEVEDYNKLIRKVEAERPDDADIWPLVALGAFLFGLYVGGRREDGQ